MKQNNEWKELDEITETINNTKYVEAELVKELLKEKCCMGGCGDINCEHCKEETIMDKALRHYNYLHSKKLCDKIDDINWANSKNSVIISPHKPTKVEKCSAGMWNFLKGIINNLKP